MNRRPRIIKIYITWDKIDMIFGLNTFYLLYLKNFFRNLKHVRNTTTIEQNAIHGIEPNFENGVWPVMGWMTPESSVEVKGSSSWVIRPLWSIIAVNPLFVARSIGFDNSMARICAICRCCWSAYEFPIHESLLIVCIILAPTEFFATRSGYSTS